MNTITQEDIKNIIALISIAPIKGSDAETVSILQKKLFKLLDPVEKDKKETK